MCDLHISFKLNLSDLTAHCPSCGVTITQLGEHNGKAGSCIKDDILFKASQAKRKGLLNTVGNLVRTLSELDDLTGIEALEPEMVYDIFDGAARLVGTLAMYEFDELFKVDGLKCQSSYADITRLLDLFASAESLGENALLAMYYSENPVWNAFFENLFGIADYMWRQDGRRNVYVNFAIKEGFSCRIT